MLLQMELFHSFSWLVFHCIYRPHLYPFLCWWALRLLPCLGRFIYSCSPSSALSLPSQLTFLKELWIPAFSILFHLIPQSIHSWLLPWSLHRNRFAQGTGDLLIIETLVDSAASGTIAHSLPSRSFSWLWLHHILLVSLQFLWPLTLLFKLRLLHDTTNHRGSSPLTLRKRRLVEFVTLYEETPFFTKH